MDYKNCIGNGCGKPFDSDVPETRATLVNSQTRLKLFWWRYCPEHRLLAQPQDVIVESRSAWDALLPEYRSEHKGWSKAGEFYCHLCSTSIGKNLRGEKPFWFASEHLATHKS